MKNLKKSFRKFSYIIRHYEWSVDSIVLVAASIFCLMCTYFSIVSMTRNWELSERLSTERKNLELITIETEMAELENEYLKSEEYQELSARKLLDKQLPGEHLVILPENSEAAKKKHQPETTAVPEKTYSNPEKWWLFLFPPY